MIELDDPVTKINLGLDEYIALNEFDVKTIRQFLLFDVDRVLSLRIYTYINCKRLSTWQKLLRKYLTYEKLHGARKKEDVPEEEAKIYDPISQIGLDTEDVEVLQTLGIQTLLDFLEADMRQILTQKGYNKSICDRLISFQDRLSNKELLEKAPVEEPLLKEITGRTAAGIEEPEKTVSPKEFLDEPVSEIGLNSNELEVLETLHVKTIQEFLEFNVNRVLDIKGYSEKTYLRLLTWQKYFRKRMHWKKQR